MDKGNKDTSQSRRQHDFTVLPTSTVKNNNYYKETNRKNYNKILIKNYQFCNNDLASRTKTNKKDKQKNAATNKTRNIMCKPINGKQEKQMKNDKIIDDEIRKFNKYLKSLYENNAKHNDSRDNCKYGIVRGKLVDHRVTSAFKNIKEEIERIEDEIRYFYDNIGDLDRLKKTTTIVNSADNNYDRSNNFSRNDNIKMLNCKIRRPAVYENVNNKSNIVAAEKQHKSKPDKNIRSHHESNRNDSYLRADNILQHQIRKKLLHDKLNSILNSTTDKANRSDSGYHKSNKNIKTMFNNNYQILFSENVDDRTEHDGHDNNNDDDSNRNIECDDNLKDILDSIIDSATNDTKGIQTNDDNDDDNYSGLAYNNNNNNNDIDGVKQSTVLTVDDIRELEVFIDFIIVAAIKRIIAPFYYISRGIYDYNKKAFDSDEQITKNIVNDNDYIQGTQSNVSVQGTKSYESVTESKKCVSFSEDALLDENTENEEIKQHRNSVISNYDIYLENKIKESFEHVETVDDETSTIESEDPPVDRADDRFKERASVAPYMLPYAPKDSAAVDDCLPKCICKQSSSNNNISDSSFDTCTASEPDDTTYRTDTDKKELFTADNYSRVKELCDKQTECDLQPADKFFTNDTSNRRKQKRFFDRKKGTVKWVIEFSYSIPYIRCFDWLKCNKDEADDD